MLAVPSRWSPLVRTIAFARPTAQPMNVTNFDLPDWGQIYADHSRSVYVQARIMLGNSDDAADVTQDVFEKAHRNWKHYDPDRSLRAWLLGITSHEVLNYLRRRKLRSWIPLSGSEVTHDDLPMDSEVWTAVRELPVRHRAVVSMFYIQGLPIEEIADQLGIPVGTVGSRLHTARQHLRALLERGRHEAGL